MGHFDSHTVGRLRKVSFVDLITNSHAVKKLEREEIYMSSGWGALSGGNALHLLSLKFILPVRSCEVS